MTDEALVEQARRGDSAAFGELVQRHQAAVLRTARAICGSREEAEDVAQEALVAAWQKLPAFRGDAQFKTWLIAIAWRHAVSRRSSVWRRLRGFVELDAAGAPEPVGAGRSSEQVLVGEAFAGDVKRLVATLPEKLRQPLLLAAAGDLTFEDMSAVLGVPTGTLKWRVMEARRRLKQKLAAAGHEVAR